MAKMAEAYVEAIMDSVAAACQTASVNEGEFWHWLGNVKFQQDGGDLTAERAEQIRGQLTPLLEEFRRYGEEL